MTRPSELDRELLRVISTAARGGTIERGAIALSRAGEYGACWVALGRLGALVDRRRGARWRLVARATVRAFAASQIVKWTVRRPRPRFEWLAPRVEVKSGRSFPSSHAATAFAAAAALATVIPRWLAYVAAVAMAATRPFLGVHYPSDSLAGALIGWRVGQSAVRRFERGEGPAGAPGEDGR